LSQILDEKSLIKKYQKEITSLKTELEQLRRGIMGQPYAMKENSEDLAHLRKQVLNWHYMTTVIAKELGKKGFGMLTCRLIQIVVLLHFVGTAGSWTSENAVTA
jgi:hypothetical protein